MGTFWALFEKSWPKNPLFSAPPPLKISDIAAKGALRNFWGSSAKKRDLKGTLWKILATRFEGRGYPQILLPNFLPPRHATDIKYLTKMSSNFKKRRFNFIKCLLIRKNDFHKMSLNIFIAWHLNKNTGNNSNFKLWSLWPALLKTFNLKPFSNYINSVARV